jgi:hypothetical protein
MARIEIKTIPATAELIEKAIEEKKAEDKTVKKVTKRKVKKEE